MGKCFCVTFPLASNKEDKIKATIQDEILALEKKIFRVQEQINSLKNE